MNARNRIILTPWGALTLHLAQGYVLYTKSLTDVCRATKCDSRYLRYGKSKIRARIVKPLSAICRYLRYRLSHLTARIVKLLCAKCPYLRYRDLDKKAVSKISTYRT